jgi:Family of unknown function (DUF6328)
MWGAPPGTILAMAPEATPQPAKPRIRDSILTGGLFPEDTHNERPGESHNERVDRELIELLNEMRVVLPGVQVLFAFLFAAPFATGWRQVTDLQARVYMAAILAAALSNAFLIAPTTYHRLTFRMGFKERLIRLGNVCLLAGTLMLAISVALALFVVTSVVVDDAWALVVAVVTGVVLLGLWYVYPLSLRERDEDRREREMDSHPSHS